MQIKYLPNVGFEINSISFKWGEDRSESRTKLEDAHTVDDRIIDLAQFFGGDESKNITQRRDVFTDYKGTKNYFFFSYTIDDKLNELEVHWGATILVEGLSLDFEKDINTYVHQLAQIDEDYREVEPGDFFFPNLKLDIANSESCGAEGNGLNYFYGANNVDHLLEK